MVQDEPSRVQERTVERREGVERGRQVAPHAAVRGSPTTGWPMALKCTRIWCVRPVAMATRTSDTAPRTSARVIRVTALRARRARADIFCRLTGSRPIGTSMRRPARTIPQTRATYSFSTSRSLELPAQLEVSRIVLGHDHQPRCAPVQPVHDTRAQLAADPAQILDVMEQAR